jgi:hypothetical protein
LKTWALFIRGLGAWLGFLIRSIRIGHIITNSFYFSKRILGSMWFLPFLSTNFCIRFPLILGGKYTRLIDQGWREILGGQGIYTSLRVGSILVRKVQYNEFRVHLLFSFVILLLSFLLFCS